MNTLYIVIEFIVSLAALLFVLRFLLQACGADFYNPISQAVVKATDPLCKPLRMVIPSFRNLDFAALIAAWLIWSLAVVLISLLISGTMPAAAIPSAMWMGFIRTLLVLTQFYFWAILIIVVASFVAQGAYHPALILLHQLVEPIMAPVRRILPSLGPLDLSPMVVMLVIFVVEDILRRSI